MAIPEEKPFEFKDLPKEIRELVYPHELAISHDSMPASFFLAIAADPSLLAEAKPIYHEVNYVLTKDTVEHFRTMPMKKLMKIKHLNIVFGQNDVDFNPFRANKAILLNNLRTIILDFTGIAQPMFNLHPSSSIYWEQVVNGYVNASSGVEKVVMKLGPRWCCLDEESEPIYPVTHLNQLFGMGGRLEEISCLGKEADGTHSTFGIWTWEAKVGDSFKSNKIWARSPRQAS